MNLVLDCARYEVEVAVHDYMNDGPWKTLIYVWEEDWNFEPDDVIGANFPWGWRPVTHVEMGGCRHDQADGGYRDSLVFELFHPTVTLDEVLS